MAAARFTRDSNASESNPTEPVIAHASSLSPSVNKAAPMESQAYVVREREPIYSVVRDRESMSLHP